MLRAFVNTLYSSSVYLFTHNWCAVCHYRESNCGEEHDNEDNPEGCLSGTSYSLIDRSIWLDSWLYSVSQYSQSHRASSLTIGATEVGVDVGINRFEDVLAAKVTKACIGSIMMAIVKVEFRWLILYSSSFFDGLNNYVEMERGYR